MFARSAFNPSLIATILLVAIVFCAPGIRADSLTGVFAKGSEWHLFVDGWDGPMTIDSMVPRAASDGRVHIESDITWLKMPSRLKVVQYPGDVRRDVEFVVATPDGERFQLTGRLAHSRVPFMAGTSRSERSNSVRHGSWYATRTKAGKSSAENTISSDSFQAVAKPSVAIANCKLSGQITGSLQYVQGVWLRASDGNTMMIDIRPEANGQFQQQIAAGTYKLAVVPKGKISLRGSGLEQQFSCTDSAAHEIRAMVTGITE